MLVAAEKPRLIRAALFVDFDNIYIGLRHNVDEAAAELFATDPMRWVRWLERGMTRPDTAEEAQPIGRRVLVRRCYLNPKSHHRYRPFFTRSGFKVVDCPSLTHSGKNSADILMVMDILDALHHDTHFEEFILFSGDADFTPVLLRLRENNRVTAVLTVGPTAEAYVAASEQVITEDVFIEAALGLSAEAQARSVPRREEPRSSASEATLRQIADFVYEAASEAGEIPALALPRIFQRSPEFTRESNWLGFYSLRRMAERLVSLRNDLRIVEGDPWRVVIVPALEPAPTSEAPAPDSEPATVPPEENQGLRERIVARVTELVSNATDPVAMSRAADVVRSELGPRVLETQWAGAGTFRALLDSVPTPPFRIITAPDTPGYLCDPARHDVADPSILRDPLETDHPELAELARRVHQLTGAPRFTPAQFAMLFESLSRELSIHPYHLNSTSKAVRDLCIERGESLSRASVTWVIRGIAYAGHPFGDGPQANTPEALAQSYYGNLLTLCSGAQLELSDAEEALMSRWIMGGLESQQPAQTPVQ